MRSRLLGIAVSLAVGLGPAAVALPQTPIAGNLPSHTVVDDNVQGTGLTPSEQCDGLDPANCLLPLPNDHFTRFDPTTDTGRRLDLELTATPRNIAGKPIDPAGMNRNDGWSPGAHIITLVPGIDFEASNLPPIDDTSAWSDPASGVVVINTRTGQRHPVWAEMDTSADGAIADASGLSALERPLLVRPLVNWDESTTYVVALQNLKNADGARIGSSDLFRTYRDRIYTTKPSVETRRGHMEQIISTATAAGINRDDLYLAWDFTVASERNLSERILKMRDETFAQLGDADLADSEIAGAAPDYELTSVQDCDEELQPQPTDLVGTLIGLIDDIWDTVHDLLTGNGSPVGPNDAPVGPGDAPSGAAENCKGNSTIKWRIRGNVKVPNYMSAPAAPPGSQMLFGLDGLPMQNPTGPIDVPFQCEIPRVASATAPARPGLYGHGLLGSYLEMQAGNVESMANEQNFMFCATYWAGMSELDLGNVAATLGDLSNFHTMADRMQQGMLNFLVLGRLAAHPDGLASNPLFGDLIEAGELVYDGNSQGGIMGGALTAVAPDFTKAVLGVPAINYSTLLDRSVDFDVYSIPMYAAYPDRIDQQVIFHLIQLLWDRGEGNGYAHHMTGDPYPNTPAHDVLMHVAYGDHQVAIVAAEVQGRTIGAAAYRPTTPPAGFPSNSGTYAGRHWATNDPMGGFGEYFDTTHSGSAFVYWDTWEARNDSTTGYAFLAATPPNGNTPPRPDLGYGGDPHSRPRSDSDARVQKGQFLRQATVANVCNSLPCNAERSGLSPTINN